MKTVLTVFLLAVLSLNGIGQNATSDFKTIPVQQKNPGVSRSIRFEHSLELLRVVQLFDDQRETKPI